MSDKSDTPRTDALQEQLAAMDGPECLYTEEMADRMWLLMRDLEEKLTYLFANAVGDSMALGIMELQRRELAAAKEGESCYVALAAAQSDRADKAEAERDAAKEGDEAYDELCAALVGDEMTTLREDAEKWRAFIGCARIRAVGWAELYTPTPYAHLGIDLWTMHEAPSDPKDIEHVEQFVSKCIAIDAERAK